MLGKLFATLLFAVMVLAAPQGAQAVTYTGPDVSIGSAMFCSGNFGCGTGTPTLTFDTSDDATRTASGFVTVVGNLVSFDVTV